jgi:D-inositol-3-phosphate glycosyltransferase
MRAKRILIVSHYYPPHIGGIEIVAYNDATRLALLGHQVSVVTSRTAGDPTSGTFEGVRVIRVPAYNGFEAKAIPFPIFPPALFFQLWREVRRADIVHIHDVFYISSFTASFVAWIHHKPTVVSQHVAMVSHPSKLTTMIERSVYRTTGIWTLKKSKRVITINSRVQRFVADLGVTADKVIAMNNGVNTKLFHRPSMQERKIARKTFQLPEAAFIVLFIGRFVPKKGFDVMRKAGASTFLSVFAGGETELLPNKNQRFIGGVTQTRLSQLYQAADLFVLPSDSEGFPLTAQEAMASGVPVVLKYDQGYDRYKLSSNEVVFMDGTSASDLRTLITDLQNDAARRKAMAEQAFRYVEKHFTWDRHISALNSVYDQILKQTKVRS